MTDQFDLEPSASSVHPGERSMAAGADTPPEPLPSQGAFDAAPAAMDAGPRDASVESLRAFFEQHRDQHTQAGLRDCLVRAGYSSTSIDLAQAQVYGFDLAPPTPTPARVSSGGLTFGLSLFATLLLNYFIAPIFAVLLLIRSNPELAWFVLLLVPIELAVWLALRRRRRELARGLRWGLIGTLPILAAALLIGWSAMVVLGI